jgi:hypothetical protein
MNKKTLLFLALLISVWTSWHIVALRRFGPPVPRVHDEFSYLLGADTLAHGRLANPPNPLAAFFESPHELARPTYASKYPPGQAMFLALGQVTFGHPFYGVLISDIFMLSALCLMLAVWVSPRAMAVVSILFAVILSPSMYWTASYWGGAVAAGAGALVLLAVGLFLNKATAVSGLIFAIGVLLLLWTRPYEGGIFTLAVLLVFGKQIWRRRRLAPLVAFLLLSTAGITWTCLDNRAITGHFFQLPYLLHSKQYDVVPSFWFLPLNPQPVYSHPRLAALHGATNSWELSNYEPRHPSWKKPFMEVRRITESLDSLLFAALIMVLVVPCAWTDSMYLRMTSITFVFVLGLSLETFATEHYTAPVWAALALMMAIWLENALRVRLYKSRYGATLVGLVLVYTHFLQLSYEKIRPQQELYGRFPLTADCVGPETVPSEWQYRRSALICRLLKRSTSQLVIVRYPSTDWDVTQEWVYNGADIDSQRVVFAHDLGTQKDQELLQHYPKRTANLLTFDSSSGMEKLEPFPGTQ